MCHLKPGFQGALPSNDLTVEAQMGWMSLSCLTETCYLSVLFWWKGTQTTILMGTTGWWKRKSCCLFCCLLQKCFNFQLPRRPGGCMHERDSIRPISQQWPTGMRIMLCCLGLCTYVQDESRDSRLVLGPHQGPHCRSRSIDSHPHQLRKNIPKANIH